MLKKKSRWNALRIPLPLALPVVQFCAGQELSAQELLTLLPSCAELQDNEKARRNCLAAPPAALLACLPSGATVRTTSSRIISVGNNCRALLRLHLVGSVRRGGGWVPVVSRARMVPFFLRVRTMQTPMRLLLAEI